MRHRVRIKEPWNLRVGADSWIGEDVRVDNSGPTEIGANVVLSQSAQLACPSGGGTAPLRVEDGAWIALRAEVLGPCTIGRRAVVGAAATVSSDVAEGQVVKSPNVVTVASCPDLI
jgi:putative colanic acid biosynthesis acetyltransferase WcaF